MMVPKIALGGRKRRHGGKLIIILLYNFDLMLINNKRISKRDRNIKKLNYRSKWTKCYKRKNVHTVFWTLKMRKIKLKFKRLQGYTYFGDLGF